MTKRRSSCWRTGSAACKGEHTFYLTVRIAATLAERGLPVEDIVDTISRTLPVCKTRNLAYSTFTIVHIDAAGYARLVEFDNPPALLIRNGELVNLVRRKRRVGTHTA